MSWIRVNWLSVLGVVIGLLGVGFSFYFYKLSEKEREPVFLVDPYRSIIVEANTIKDFPLKVVDRDGRNVEKDITSVRFYFWNEGRETIKKSEILKPLKITIASPDVEVIGYKILSSSRADIVQPVLSLESGSNNVLNVSFDILEKDDGFSAQIIFAGSPNAAVELKGTIEGVKGLKGRAEVSSYHFYKTLMILFGLPILFVSASALLASWLKPWFSKILSRFFDTSSLSARSKKLLPFTMMFGVFLGFTSSLYVIYTKERQRIDIKVLSSMMATIPEAIKPVSDAEK